MGEEHRPRDVLKGRRALIRKSLQDLSPGLREGVLELFESWKGKRSEEKLRKLVGEKKAERLIKKFRR
ncbi:MAG: hypothetical protein ACOC6H_04470 [Thermoproteota archaeon]